MARMQIVWLPAHPDSTARPFAVVFDQAGEHTPDQTEELTGFGAAIGANGTLVTALTIDLAEERADEPGDTHIHLDSERMGRTVEAAVVSALDKREREHHISIRPYLGRS